MSEEVTNPYGIAEASRNDPAMQAAMADAMRLRGKQVIDVNGQPLGRVSRAFAEEGALLRMDVRLSGQARRMFDVDEGRAVAGVPADAIARVDGDEVRLSQAAEEILHPERAGMRADTHELGAPELPRKER